MRRMKPPPLGITIPSSYALLALMEWLLFGTFWLLIAVGVAVVLTLTLLFGFVLWRLVDDKIEGRR